MYRANHQLGNRSNDEKRIDPLSKDDNHPSDRPSLRGATNTISEGYASGGNASGRYAGGEATTLARK